ncbi:hypothetical protein FHETE_12 [Fusarium heterosporum]|uniref:F-box domain-containing protein n=1 Tax=Fusarium heterosporum TaxID=42747 RepID=A0A8H5U592_FUSHE|nr:hypothetical protein FHETE_12 [Fusarium heterosporum]
MGYSEVYCHICGVSFNISRGRTDKEPRTAAWGDECAFTSGYSWEQCPENGGCFFVQRDPNGNDSTLATEELTKLILPKVNPEDPEESYEYASGDWDDTPDDWEHIASPECEQDKAYNGHHISAQAMRGCKTLQCLVRKPKDWRPAPDDEAFEAHEQFFLSGLSDHMPSRDMSSPIVYPERHGVSSPNAENCIWEPEDAEDYAMPFHPTCLEIFKRASLHRYGVVDIECLTQWWELEAAYEDFYAFPRHEDVNKASEQWWNHLRGGEYLVANPCFVPGLESLLSSTKSSRDSGHKQSKITLSSVVSDTKHPDVFLRLPAEIRLLLLLELSYKDIANLRLASRTFLDLPQSLFYHLTMRDTPWLYEAWSSLPISFWATTTEKEAREIGITELRNRSSISEPRIVAPADANAS